VRWRAWSPEAELPAHFRPLPPSSLKSHPLYVPFNTRTPVLGRLGEMFSSRGLFSSVVAVTSMIAVRAFVPLVPAVVQRHRSCGSSIKMAASSVVSQDELKKQVESTVACCRAGRMT
jgi:hypothetical protein